MFGIKPFQTNEFFLNQPQTFLNKARDFHVQDNYCGTTFNMIANNISNNFRVLSRTFHT